MRKLALDLGTVSCGFAISDPFNMIASGLINLRFKEGDLESVFLQIDKYLQEYEIDTFILGYPKRMTGTKSDTTYYIEDFKTMLESRYSHPVILVDERESTKEARNLMIQANLSRKKQKQKKDSLAAQIILERYLGF